VDLPRAVLNGGTFSGCQPDGEPAKLSALGGDAAAGAAEAVAADALPVASLLFLSHPPHSSCGNLLEPGIYQFLPLIHRLRFIGHFGSNLRSLSATPNEFI
jgi:hypothetical protein